MQRSLDRVRLAQAGLPKDQLVPGAIVTISANKLTGDRSHVMAIWEIVARNACHVLVRNRGPVPPSDGTATQLVVLDEHEFYGADHMAAVIRDTEQ